MRSPHQARVQHAAVEQHVRRTGQPARSAPHRAVLRRGRLLPQEARHVARDRRRRPRTAGRSPAGPMRRCCAGISVLATAGRKPSSSTCSISPPCSVALIVPPTSPVPLPRMVTGASFAFAPGSSSFSLATRQFAHSA